MADTPVRRSAEETADEATELNADPEISRSRIPEEIVENGDDKCSIVSIVCRICFDDNKEEGIITPCKCKGTVAFVHRTCLEKWLSESNTTSCELCHHVYETERVPKYTAKESLWQWMRHQPTNLGFRVRHIRCDIIACSILTPLAVVITYICLFSADYYSQQRFESIPTARWTSISLLIMIAIMLFGYYIWVYVVVGYHGRMWYYWWQRECIVRYIPPPAMSVTPMEGRIRCCDEVECAQSMLPNSDSNEVRNSGGGAGAGTSSAILTVASAPEAVEESDQSMLVVHDSVSSTNTSTDASAQTAKSEV